MIRNRSATICLQLLALTLIVIFIWLARFPKSQETQDWRRASLEQPVTLRQLLTVLQTGLSDREEDYED